jgi:hypothetical protein
MSGPRRIVVARQGFISSLSHSLRGKSLAVDGSTGVVRAGTKLWSDHPLVLANPEQFLDATELPPPVGPAEPSPPALNVPAAARGLTESQIRQTVAQLRQQLDRAPTKAETAAQLHTSEATLKRAMQDLSMGRWPPAPPQD